MRARRVERVHGRVDALLRDRAVEHRRRVEVGEGGGGRGVGQVVGWHVDGLHGRDRALGRRRDPLLHRAHVGGEGRLVSHRRRDAAEQRGHLRPGLGEPEDVVDEEQHVLALVAEVLGDRQAGERDAGAGARRLVHLAVDQRRLGARRRAVVRGRVHVHLGLDHLPVEVVALPGALADAGEDRVAAVHLGDVVDQLLDQHRLADPGAAEQADLAAARVGAEQVHDLDARHQDLALGRLLNEGRGVLVDAAARLGPYRAELVHRLADDVHDAPQRALADRHLDRLPRVGRRPGRAPAPRSESIAIVRTVFSPRCWATSSTRRLPLLSVSSALRMAGRVVVELDVDDGADHLCDASSGHVRGPSGVLSGSSGRRLAA